MAQWRVQIQGDDFDLEAVRDILSGEPSIIQDGSNFYLTSQEWDQVNDAEEIHKRANAFIQLLENAAFFYFRDTAPLTVGGVGRLEDDGRIHWVIFAKAVASARARVRATGTVIGPDNKPLEVKQEHPVLEILRASKQYPNVQGALEFFHKGDWVNLYKAYELVSDEVGGKQEIIARKWISETSLDRFTRMAQSREGLGDAARHASKKFKPPKKPVSLKEAKDIIASILQNWIRSL